MPAERNLALQLIISAKDQASSVLSKLFGFLDSEVSVVAGKIRNAFTGLFGGGLDGAIEFEAQLDKVQAKGGYTAEAMVELKKAAIEIGAQFGLSGTQAAQGMESLAAAGLTATQTMQALPSVLALAKAEALSMDDASGLLANSLTTVGLGFDQAARLANVLTQAANESTTSATAVGKALETAGGIARTAGLDLEQTVAVLTALAKSGIEGERAGTALAAILTQLLNPASKASEELSALNITSRDLGTVIGELQSKGVNANAAILAFGETAGPGLRALISQGQQGIADLEQALLGADGAAQKAAEGMGGNLKGAMEALESSLDTVKSTLAEPILEPLTKAARNLSAAFTKAVEDGNFSVLQDTIKLIAIAAGNAADALIKAFDFKVIGERVNNFIVGGLGVLGQAFNNLQAIIGGFAAAALIPLGLQLKSAVEATVAFVAAQRAAITSMTATEIAAAALNRTLAILAGPAGWILAGVTAFALLWKEEDKTKAATDALATSTEEYTQKLKDQSAAQNQVALNKINDALGEQRKKLLDAKAAYEQATQSGRDFIVVTEDHGVILGKTTKVISDAAEIERIRQERLAEVDKQTRLLNATEERRQQIINELKAKQEAANPVQEAAAAALGKYRTAVEDAEAAQKKAREELGKLTAGSYDYGIAAGRAAQADANLKLAKEVLTKAESDYNAEVQRRLRELPVATKAQDDHAKTIQEGVRELEKGVTGAKKYTDSVEGLVKAETAGIRAEIELARAKGDTAEVQRLTQKLALQEAEGAVRVAKAKEAEQQMEYALAVAKRNQTAALVEKNQATKEDLELADLTVQKELAEAQAAGINTQAQEVLLQKLREIRQLQQGGLQIQQQVNEQTEQNTENTKDNTDANEGNAKSYTLMENAAVGAIRELSGLSAGMEELISKMLHVDGVGRMFGHEFRGELGKLQLQLNQTNQALEHNAKIISPLVGLGFERMANVANKARQMYLEQAIAATELAGRLQDVTDSAGGNQTALRNLVTGAEKSITAMRLLDQQTLDRLQSAIDAANDKLREMKQETQDAKDRLQELNAELAEARGEDKKAQELRQQLEFQTDLAAIEDQRRKAELTGNTEALRALDEQKKVLEALNKIRIDNIRSPDIAEKQRRYYEDAQRAPERTGGGLATNTFNINVDGRDLLSEDQIRNKIIPVLNRATRLSK